MTRQSSFNDSGLLEALLICEVSTRFGLVVGIPVLTLSGLSPIMPRKSPIWAFKGASILTAYTYHRVAAVAMIRIRKTLNPETLQHRKAPSKEHLNGPKLSLQQKPTRERMYEKSKGLLAATFALVEALKETVTFLGLEHPHP